MTQLRYAEHFFFSHWDSHWDGGEQSTFGVVSSSRVAAFLVEPVFSFLKIGKYPRFVGPFTQMGQSTGWCLSFAMLVVFKMLLLFNQTSYKGWLINTADSGRVLHQFLIFGRQTSFGFKELYCFFPFLLISSVPSRGVLKSRNSCGGCWVAVKWRSLLWRC